MTFLAVDCKNLSERRCHIGRFIGRFCNSRGEPRSSYRRK